MKAAKIWLLTLSLSRSEWVDMSLVKALSVSEIADSLLIVFGVAIANAKLCRPYLVVQHRCVRQ
ncbi:hypothetical protein NKI54_32865 [Mesorhizobium sp. M0663]|uniref:hypothetical protein n=1 Tax=Mesorhizobium sp. M0663 TaxID=2956981 RepID=UPI003335D7E4